MLDAFVLAVIAVFALGFAAGFAVCARMGLTHLKDLADEGRITVNRDLQ